MPIRVITLILLLPVLVACSAASYPENESAGQQALLDDVYHWAPALEPALAPDSQQIPMPTPPEPAPELDDPVQAQALALSRSPAIRAILASQGIAHAGYRQATLIDNPGLSISALRPDNGGRWQTEIEISLGILDWLTQPLRQQLAGAELDAARARALDALSIELGSVRAAYFSAIAGRQLSSQHQSAAETARLNAEMARHLNEAGNLSELDRLRYDSQLARQQQIAAQSSAEADAALVTLKLKTGLNFDSELILPVALPDTDSALLDEQQLQALLQNSDAFTDLLTRTWQRRPDYQLLRESRVALDRQLRLQQRRSGMTQLGLGLVAERETDGSNNAGLALDLSLPLFDQGQADNASTRAHLAQLTADEQASQLAMEARIRTTINNLLSMVRQIKQMRDEDIPRHQRMLELTLQEYNFMLSDTFDLLSVKQEESETRISYIKLLERYWLEHAMLMQLTANTAEQISFKSDPESISGAMPTNMSPSSSAQPDATTSETDHANHQEHQHD